MPVGMTPGERRGRGAGFWIRTVLASAVGVVAAGLLALAGILSVFALVALLVATAIAVRAAAPPRSWPLRPWS